MVNISTPNVNQIQQLAKNAKTPLRSAVRSVAKDGYGPVIALEAFVEAGRTFQAYQRGGFDEARERITEEFSGAVFWLGGMPALNWVGNKLGKKALKLQKQDFSTASDNVRKPFQNYLSKMLTTDGKALNQKAIERFKFGQVIANVLIINAFIGFAVPKMNQAITRWYHKNNKDKVNQQPQTLNTKSKPTTPQNTNNNNQVQNPEQNKNIQGSKLNVTMNDFVQNVQNKGKDVTFGMNLLNLANKFETDRNYKLLSVDAGTASGRAYNARNNDERCEILFRDLGSIYFYMFNMANMNKWLNKIEQGRATRLEPVSERFTTNYIQEFLKQNDNKMNINDFENVILGKRDVQLPKAVSEKIKDGVISLDDFKSAIKPEFSREELSSINELAQKTSTLQPKINNVAILTEKQAKDVLTGGALNNPEFLEELYKISHKDFKDEFAFVSQKDLDLIKDDAEFYVKQIVKKAKKANLADITVDMLEKASKDNKIKGTINYGVGFAVSALFLSTIIPKMQYMLTKWRTGKNEFPGTSGLDDNQKQNSKIA